MKFIAMNMPKLTRRDPRQLLEQEGLVAAHAIKKEASERLTTIVTDLVII